MKHQFPIGKLQVAEEVTLADVELWMDQIEGYTERLRDTVDSLSEKDLAKTYREDSWNVRQLIHHVADSQIVMYQRLKLALTDHTPTTPNFEQDRWATLADNELPIESSITILEGINQRIVALGRSLTEKDLKRSFIHEKHGPITVATKLAKLSWHEEHHLAHIHIALKT